MSQQNSAESALKTRVRSLEAVIKQSTRERDNHQMIVDLHQKRIDDAVAETNSINAAIELLDAAKEYANE